MTGVLINGERCAPDMNVHRGQSGSGTETGQGDSVITGSVADEGRKTTQLGMYAGHGNVFHS